MLGLSPSNSGKARSASAGAALGGSGSGGDGVRLRRRGAGLRGGGGGHVGRAEHSRPQERRGQDHADRLPHGPRLLQRAWRPGFFTKYVQKNIHLYKFKNNMPLSTAATTNFTHGELATALRKAPPLPDEPVEIFIGILSSGNHFAERMGVRKTWMSAVQKSPNVVARFFVALHGRKEVDVELKKEANFFGDIVFVPFLDNYDLVVLKTLAICEYGVHVLC